MNDDRFEFIDHTADWAMRVFGRDLRQLLINAAHGMNSLMAPAEGPHGNQVRPVAISALDCEGLLVDWLSELAFLAETERLLFHQFSLYEVTPTQLEGTFSAGGVAEIQRDIKAVTYHDLKILETETGLEVVVVFDV